MYINCAAVESVSRTTFLEVHLADYLSSTINTTAIIKKAQQQVALYPLRRLRKAGLPTAYLTTSYKGTIESILSYSLISWFSNCKGHEKMAR